MPCSQNSGLRDWLQAGSKQISGRCSCLLWALDLQHHIICYFRFNFSSFVQSSSVAYKTPLAHPGFIIECNIRQIHFLNLRRANMNMRQCFNSATEEYDDYISVLQASPSQNPPTISRISRRCSSYRTPAPWSLRPCHPATIPLIYCTFPALKWWVSSPLTSHWPDHIITFYILILFIIPNAFIFLI